MQAGRITPRCVVLSDMAGACSRAPCPETIWRKARWTFRAVFAACSLPPLTTPPPCTHPIASTILIHLVAGPLDRKEADRRREAGALPFFCVDRCSSGRVASGAFTMLKLSHPRTTTHTQKQNQAELKRQEKYPNLATPHRLKGLDVSGVMHCGRGGLMRWMACGACCLLEPNLGQHCTAPERVAACAVRCSHACTMRCTNRQYPAPGPRRFEQGIRIAFVAGGPTAVHAMIGDVNGNVYTWGRNEVR